MHIYWNEMSLDSSTARNECCLRNLPIPPPLACLLAALAGRLRVCLHATTHVTRKPPPPYRKRYAHACCWKLETGNTTLRKAANHCTMAPRAAPQSPPPATSDEQVMTMTAVAPGPVLQYFNR